MFYNFFYYTQKMSECNSIELTYQKNKDVILNRSKDYYENYKERLMGKQEKNTETYLKKKIKRENIKKTDTTICLKKKKKNKSKQIIAQ